MAQTQTQKAATGVFGLEGAGLRALAGVHWNLPAPALYEISLQRGEGHLAACGPLVVTTGQHTGRAASDKFIVKDADSADQVCWDSNKPMTPQAFETLHRDMAAYAEGRELFAQDLFAGADAAHRLAVRVITERAWHSLFIRNLLIEPDGAALAAFMPAFTIMDFPGFAADPLRHGCESTTVIAVNFSRRLILIAGTSYGGEIKKSVFTILNYLLPLQQVMPMHCSANIGPAGDVAIFFGLSGTGKTTLSAEPSRTLVGDDEHGWGSGGVFNFEGGCYAKVIRLSRDAEPGIYAVTERFGTVLENVVCDPATGKPDFDDNRYTENTRAAYPIDFIPHASRTGCAGQPSNVIMLTADAFGILPPIAKLTPSQAMYHFLSGFTAKVAGTEKGLGSEPQPTFSACFGAPFMPRHPAVYGALLRELIARHNVNCWLINTGWTGGAYGVGTRMPIGVTRTLLAAALNGDLAEGTMRTDPYFGFAVPLDAPGVDGAILDPRATWQDAAAYDRQAEKLVGMFHANFRSFETHVAPDVLAAAPHLPA
jgi:phosphoenolpyruvate carboxykinase (ATP)